MLRKDGVKMVRKTYDVHKYGLVGDGHTNDLPALQKLCAEVCKHHGPTCIEFKKGKSYRLLPADGVTDYQWGMLLSGVRDCQILGHGAMLLPKTPVNCFGLYDCNDVVIDGFIIDHLPLPFCVARLVDVNPSEPSFTARILPQYPALDCDADESVDNGSVWQFMIPKVLGRHHLYIRNVVSTNGSKSSRDIKVNIAKAGPWENRMQILAEQRPLVWLPVPGIGHGGGYAMHVGGSDGVQFRNVNVWSGPSFLFSIKGNKGPISFENVNVVPKPGTNRAMTAWRDGYHCKNNRGAISWKNCRVEGLHDDVVNLSNHYIYLNKVLADDTWQVNFGEAISQNGDYLRVINVNSGRDYGYVHIRRIEKRTEGEVMTINKPLPVDDIAGIRIINESIANPHSRIDNCRMIGTARWRSTMLATSLHFTGFMWIENETEIEGPVPHDITFRNCRMEAWAEWADLMACGTTKYGEGKTEYQLKNIRFVGCQFLGKVNWQADADVKRL